jgi:hypothetical protein
MSWDLKNDLGKLGAKGDLTKKNTFDTIKEHAILGGMSSGDASAYATKMMHEKGLNNLGDKTAKEIGTPKKTPNISFDGITIGGVDHDRGGYRGKANYSSTFSQYDHPKPRSETTDEPEDKPNPTVYRRTKNEA